MADTDVIGIVSLLLAAGGAAYLFRARLIGGRDEETPAEAPRQAAASVKPKPSAGVARDAKTLPPTLRPASERPPVAPAKAISVRTQAKTTTPESPAAKAAPPPEETSDEKKIDKLVDSEPPSTKPEEADDPNTLPPPKVMPPPRERLIIDRDDAKITPPPVTVPERKPANHKKQTIVGLPEPALLDLVPKLDFEEDEDVEPTRVGRYERQSIRPPVEKHVFDEGADADTPRDGAPLALAVYALAQTDPGKRRKQNEDSYLVREPDSLYVVADGMGGHRGGQHASKLAVETINKAFETKVFDAEAHVELPPAASELARAIQMANAAILFEAGLNSDLKGMGTTLCAAKFTDENRRLFLGHVGDSRCYRVRDGMMKQMTADHTMADYGVTGPEGSHLSRALGVWPTVPIDVIMATPRLGDVYLLCSDGLTKMLTNETIATQLLHEEDPKAAVERLVFFANAHGGKDNITIILLRVVEPGWLPPSEREPST